VSADSPLDPDTGVTVGRVLAPQGIRGEVKVEPLTDFPERFDPGAILWLEGAPVRIRSSRWQGRSVYLSLEGIDSRNDAEALRDAELRVAQLRSIEGEDRFYQHDIVGLKVETQAGEPLGSVASIFATGANDVYVVRGEQGELLLPAVDEVIKKIDLPGKRIVVELLPGLEFTTTASRRRPLAAPRSRARRPSSK
jgi:16S rRNA processing protein RimM